MYQIGYITNIYKPATRLAKYLGIAFSFGIANYGQYRIETYRNSVRLKSESIANIIEVKNFVNNIALLFVANEYDIDRCIRLLIPGYYDNDNYDAFTDDESSDDDDYY